MYKTKLQELCQKRKWKLPEYTSCRVGEDHNPLFSASVWVRGTSFDSGPACKSSKQAHNEAAQLAFLHFTSGSMSQEGSESAERTSSEEQIQSFIYPEDNMAIKILLNDQGFSSTKEIDNGKKTLGTNGLLKLAPRMASLDPQENLKNNESSSRLKNEAQTNKITGTGEKDKVRHEEEKGTEMKSYLLCNRFKLFTSIPNMVLPRGTVLLPISENMWTVVALEFPNE